MKFAGLTSKLFTSNHCKLIFRDAKKTLPKPKVGDTCSIAMEQGFSDACLALCMGERPTSRLSQSCRAAAAEMPRPTVRRWCEHGYTTAFSKTMNELSGKFIIKNELKGVALSVPQPSPQSLESSDVPEQPSITEEVDSSNPVVATIPVKLGNNSFIFKIHKDDNIEELVTDFCRENEPDEYGLTDCIEQLLPEVLQKATV